jgi:hypothetical protein
MWLPAGLIYLGAAAALFLAWLRVEEIRMQTLEVRGVVQDAAGVG